MSSDVVEGHARAALDDVGDDTGLRDEGDVGRSLAWSLVMISWLMFSTFCQSIV